ncbi:hypothetical protein JCM3766R1_005778 [Sporobolomyces carnicolor]
MNRELLKSRFDKLPRHLPPVAPPTPHDNLVVDGEDDDDAEEELADSFPNMSSPSSYTTRQRRGRQDLTPLSARGYFDQALQVRVDLSTSPTRHDQEPPPGTGTGTGGGGGRASPPPRSTTTKRVGSDPPLSLTDDGNDQAMADFRVYYTPPSRSSSTASKQTTAYGGRRREGEGNEDEDEARGVLFVCVHGAGYSGLSFACLAQALSHSDDDDHDAPDHRRRRIGVLAFDARGHGKTTMPKRDESGQGGGPEEQEQPSLDLESMSGDLVKLLKTMFPNRDEAPGLILVGHSMGGAVVADACNTVQATVADVLGVAVIDVVEGTALEALSSMSSLIAARPQTFESKQAAIGWHLDSRTINNVLSARISVPPLVKPVPPSRRSKRRRVGLSATAPPVEARPSCSSRRVIDPVIEEETGSQEQGSANEKPTLGDSGAVSPRPRRDGEQADGPEGQGQDDEDEYEWAIDLSKTEPYWKGWFTGLSRKFLNCRTAKLLILAGTDRLDKELLIGQMQGKYQLEVFPEAGHCLHEDAPERTAETLINFWERNDRTDVLKGVRKVGE